METPEISVIISTYKAEDWLEKTLWGYQKQGFKNFELLVADDGSGSETLDLIEKMRAEVFYPIVHVWQEDDGFQKSKILNKALQQCSSDYVVMSDGDCIPRSDFLAAHFQHRAEGHMLSGGYFKLPMDISEKIQKDDILSGDCFDIKWLKSLGVPASFKNNKLTAKGFKSKLLNTITPTNASWNGHNASGWKADILAVNGFDERMQYGGQDRELGERLINNGVKSKQIRYSAICLHLDHPRGYKTRASIEKNRAIRKTTVGKKLTWTPYGIVKSGA